MKEDTQLFRKVFIKTKQDLPKESGYYFAATKELMPEHCKQLWCRCYEKGHNESWWLSAVDWYLQPIEEESKPSASIDDIKKWLGNNGIGTGTNITIDSVAHLIQEFIAQWVLPIQPSQSKPVDPKEVTDEEIEKAAKEYSKYGRGMLYQAFLGFKEGAKWYRDRNKQKE
jgi:hypothetical protein